jgi:hypothetical protein
MALPSTFVRAQYLWKRFLSSAEKYAVHHLSVVRLVGSAGKKTLFNYTTHSG